MKPQSFSIGINAVVERCTEELNRLLRIVRPKESDQTWAYWQSLRKHGYIITCHDDSKGAVIIGVIVVTPIKTKFEHLYHIHLLSIDTTYETSVKKMIRNNLIRVCAETVEKVDWDQVPLTHYYKDICGNDMRTALEVLAQECKEPEILLEASSIVLALATGKHVDKDYVNTILQQAEGALREISDTEHIPTLREIVYGAYDRATVILQHHQ
ncbi:MAG: hypothetical protein WC819_06065 [Parcubacteria group bacterium]|jgi:hypothetical protein